MAEGSLKDTRALPGPLPRRVTGQAGNRSEVPGFGPGRLAHVHRNQMLPESVPDSLMPLTWQRGLPGPNYALACRLSR
jgi:hypothetical protein